MTDTTITRQDTLTLMSHPGDRALTGYGPTDHPVLDPTQVTDLVTFTSTDRWDGEQTKTYVHLYEKDYPDLWVAQPLPQALRDVAVDGDTILFDGDLPDNGGCGGPVFKIDRDRFYTPVRHEGVPFLTPQMIRGSFGAREDRVALVYADPCSHDFVRFVGGQSDRHTSPLPPFPGRRVVWTIFEADQIPEGTPGMPEVGMTLHNQDLARYWFDPVVILTRRIDRVRQSVQTLIGTLRDRAQDVQAILDGHTPDGYLPQQRSTDRSRFTVDGSAVDELVRLSKVLDLFTDPDLFPAQ